MEFEVCRDLPTAVGCESRLPARSVLLRLRRKGRHRRPAPRTPHSSTNLRSHCGVVYCRFCSPRQAFYLGLGFFITVCGQRKVLKFDSLSLMAEPTFSEESPSLIKRRDGKTIFVPKTAASLRLAAPRFGKPKRGFCLNPTVWHKPTHAVPLTRNGVLIILRSTGRQSD